MIRHPYICQAIFYSVATSTVILSVFSLEKKPRPNKDVHGKEPPS